MIEKNRFYDREEPGQELTPELCRFLDTGEPPIVFTLGSSAVNDARDFFRVSVEAACALGRRAVLLIGTDPRNRSVEPLPASILACPYAPYSHLFPHAAAIVHQGGVGTTAQGMRAGKPTLIMPYSHDQPDNAARVSRQGLSRTIDRDHYTLDRLCQALSPLLTDPAYARHAAEIGRKVSAEDGLKTACDAIEAQL